jgi:quinohemoprotein ethanol dehydrogenase
MKKLLIPIILLSLMAPTLALADGLKDFRTHCITCHGGNAKTNIRRASILKIDPTKLYLPASQMNAEEMIAIIEKGKDKMPGFEGKLSKDQITAIVEYIRSEKKK